MTSKYKKIWLISAFLSLLVNVFPVLWFFIEGMVQGHTTTQKVGLSVSLMIVIILTCYNLITKVAMRCRIWLIMVGLYLALNNFLTALIIITACQCLDELVLAPIAKHYHNLYTVNKEIDKRGTAE